jgi:hypothetical protein
MAKKPGVPEKAKTMLETAVIAAVKEEEWGVVIW